MSNFFSLINNQFTEKISVLDRGFSYGDGFFETMCWGYFGGIIKPIVKVEYWQRHFNRIKKGCDMMAIKIPNKHLILKQRDKILRHSSSSGMEGGILKLIISRGVGGRGYKFEDNMKPTIAFLTFPKPKQNLSIYDKGVKLKFCKTKLYSHNRLSGLKHLNRLDSVLARSEWRDEFFEGIFLDEKENLVEGTMTNIFFIKGETIITPPIDNSGLDGILRQVVIEKYKNFFKRIVISKVNKKMLKDFDQMFLTNSVLKVVPVKSLRNKNFIIGDNLKNLISFFRTEEIVSKKKNLEFL